MNGMEAMTHEEALSAVDALVNVCELHRLLTITPGISGYLCISGAYYVVGNVRINAPVGAEVHYIHTEVTP